MEDEDKFKIVTSKNVTSINPEYLDGLDNSILYNPSTTFANAGHVWYSNSGYWPIKVTDSYSNIRACPQVTRYDSEIIVTTDEGEHEHITRDEMLKYISERKLIQENELVRKVYERFQVALKLARSDDNGDTGI